MFLWKCQLFLKQNSLANKNKRHTTLPTAAQSRENIYLIWYVSQALLIFFCHNLSIDSFFSEKLYLLHLVTRRGARQPCQESVTIASIRQDIYRILLNELTFHVSVSWPGSLGSLGGGCCAQGAFLRHPNNMKDMLSFPAWWHCMLRGLKHVLCI